MARRIRKKLVQQHQDLVAQYRRAFKNKPFKTIDVVDWAIKRGLLHVRPVDPRFLLADEIAQAMHEEYISDPQGRRVRAKHAARYEVDGKQETLWVDIRDKNPGTRRHMQIAFQNRRQQIVGECVQLKLDLELQPELEYRNADSGSFRFHRRLGRSWLGRYSVRLRGFTPPSLCGLFGD